MTTGKYWYLYKDVAEVAASRLDATKYAWSITRDYNYEYKHPFFVLSVYPKGGQI